MPKSRRKGSKSKLSPPVRNVGFLFAATSDEWLDFIGWFDAKLKNLNSNNNAIYLPPNGAAGDSQAITDTATYLAKYFRVIVTASTEAALALKTATQNTDAQFIYASVGDPADSGLSPTTGGNFTGGSNGQADSGTVVPRRVLHMRNNPTKFKPNFAVVGDYSEPGHKQSMKNVYNELKSQFGTANLPLDPSDAACLLNSSVTDFDAFMNRLAGNPYNVQSLYICSDLWITMNAKEINKSAHRANPKIKTMFEFDQIKNNGGGDDSDSNSWQALFETAAVYADKLLSSPSKKAGDLAPYSLKKNGKGVTFHRRK